MMPIGDPPEDALGYDADMQALLELGTTGERRTLLRSVVQEIVVSRDEAAIIYSLLVALGVPDEERGP